MVKLLVMFIAVATVACGTSPTGRKQLILRSDGEMNSLGHQAFREIKTKQKVELDYAINKYVKCVAYPITREAVDTTGVGGWEIVVFRDPSANAFALPGGKIGVHTGLLKVAENQDQLAAVLGHEVGHVIARHGAERMSQGMLANVTLAVGSVVVDQKVDPKNKGLAMAGLGIGTQFGVLMPFSRKHESEADIIGLELMAKAGFDPRQSVDLWRNMGKAGKTPPEFLSSHPSPRSRMAHLKENMSEAIHLYTQAQKKHKKSPNCTPPS